MPRRWMFVCSTVLVLGVAVLLSLFIAVGRPRRCINRASFEKLKEGMSREEVIATIGLPPGDYTLFAYEPNVAANRMQLFGMIDLLIRRVDDVEHEMWASDAGVTVVYFKGGKVVWWGYDEGGPRRDAADVLKELFEFEW